ncbi:hypothetical protein GE21DRAFT_1312334 [Neurospora crassa]|nr:hypothetical protein GE21DRAFT_1312334 [Neurospora crassa]
MAEFQCFSCVCLAAAFSLEALSTARLRTYGVGYRCWLNKAVFKILTFHLMCSRTGPDRAISITKPPYPRPLRRQVLTTFLVVTDVPEPLAPGDELPDKHRHSSNWQARRLNPAPTTLAKRTRRRWVPLLGFPAVQVIDTRKWSAALPSPPL